MEAAIKECMGRSDMCMSMGVELVIAHIGFEDEAAREIELWESGDISGIQPTTWLLKTALECQCDDHVDYLVDKVPVTTGCFRKYACHRAKTDCEGHVLRKLLDHATIDKSAIPYLTHPKLIQIALPYLNSISPEEIIAGCDSKSFGALKGMGFHFNEATFIAVLRRYERCFDALDLLEQEVGLTPAVRAQAWHHKWYWDRYATEAEEQALLATLQSRLNGIRLREPRHVGAAMGPEELLELPKLPAWVAARLLDQTRDYHDVRPEWFNAEAKRAWRAELNSLPFGYGCELAGWRYLWP